MQRYQIQHKDQGTSRIRGDQRTVHPCQQLDQEIAQHLKDSQQGYRVYLPE